MSNLINSTISLLGGAGLGAAAMFLLDPDKGSERRHEITSNAGRAVSSTHDALQATLANAGQYAHQAVDQVRDHVSSKTEDLSQQAQGIASHARKAAEDAIHAALGTVRGYANSAGDYANSAARQAQNTHSDLIDRANSAYSRARSSVRQNAGVESSHPYAQATGITLGTLTVLAAGAGAMYLFDPARGISRRAMLRDQVLSFTRRTGNSARKYGRHLGNQMKGVAHDIGQQTEQWMPSNSSQTEQTPPQTESSPASTPASY